MGEPRASACLGGAERRWVSRHQKRQPHAHTSLPILRRGQSATDWQASSHHTLDRCLRTPPSARLGSGLGLGLGFGLGSGLGLGLGLLRVRVRVRVRVRARVRVRVKVGVGVGVRVAVMVQVGVTVGVTVGFRDRTPRPPPPQDTSTGATAGVGASAGSSPTVLIHVKCQPPHQCSTCCRVLTPRQIVKYCCMLRIQSQPLPYPPVEV